MAFSSVEKHIFNTYYLLLMSACCHLNRTSIQTGSQTSSHPHHTFRDLTIPSFIFPRPEWKSWFRLRLTVTHLYSKCCSSKRELRIWDEHWRSLFSVTFWDPRIRETTRHIDTSRTACYQQKCPVVTASPKSKNNTLAGGIGAVKNISPQNMGRGHIREGLSLLLF